MKLSAPTGKECPYCSHVTYKIYHTFAHLDNKTLWSDGKSYYPNFIRHSSIEKCEGCGKYYFLSDARTIKSKYDDLLEWMFAEKEIDRIFKDE